jgi:hypothetical protein
VTNYETSLKQIERKLYKETHQYNININKTILFITYSKLNEIFKLFYSNGSINGTKYNSINVKWSDVFYLLIVCVGFYCCAWSHSTTHTNSAGSPLDEGSALHIGLYLYNIKLSQDTDIHSSGGIRASNPRDQAPADIRLRPRGLRTGFNYKLHSWISWNISKASFTFLISLLYTTLIRVIIIIIIITLHF